MVIETGAISDTYRRRKCGGRITTCLCSSTLVSLIMTLHSTSDSSSIFKDGKLKPGIYKIQNIYSETYLDVKVSTREMCCRPVQDLAEGRGLVSRCPASVLHVSDYYKWEIKQFGAGYTIQRVSLPMPLNSPQPHVNDAGYRSSRENLNSFVLQWMGPRMGPTSAFLLIPWLGELKSLTTRTTMDLNTSGRDRFSSNYSSDTLTIRLSFYWTTKKILWDLPSGNASNGMQVRR